MSPTELQPRTEHVQRVSLRAKLLAGCAHGCSKTESLENTRTESLSFTVTLLSGKILGKKLKTSRTQCVRVPARVVSVGARAYGSGTFLAESNKTTNWQRPEAVYPVVDTPSSRNSGTRTNRDGNQKTPDAYSALPMVSISAARAHVQIHANACTG
ncbi:hypothetical protein ZHAS_00012807 [Anopheles sinensis]|uniref:Uncharacterized protein n=1 Tax=Anopheles sinensis TaxID=74873 RepID=A0A084W3V2_ANOSI|nr:hypothetical protein ZHAS_00012807 [Anopheles sinensis]